MRIGAVPSQEGAEALLQSARTKAPDLLATAESFTQRIEKDGEALYRARFAGFADKAQARAACAGLKRRSFACLAMTN